MQEEDGRRRAPISRGKSASWAIGQMSVVVARKVGVAAVLLAGPIILASHFLWVLEDGQPGELLQQSLNLRVRSASYYSRLAHQDAWIAGKNKGGLALSSQNAHLASRQARMQSLANWNAGALAGTAPLVTQCANGNNAACDQLAADPAAVGALKSMDASNPTGFAATRARPYTQVAAVAQQPATAPSHMMAGYQTDANTKNLWGTPAWQSGSVQDSTNMQWLKSCGEGNYYACEHLANSDDSLHDLLHPKHPYATKPASSSQVPDAVYVAHRHEGGDGLFSGISKMLGLSDTYYAAGDESVNVPKMVPDSGLLQQGSKAVYNDGTVADMLSDQAQ